MKYMTVTWDIDPYTDGTTQLHTRTVYEGTNRTAAFFAAAEAGGSVRTLTDAYGWVPLSHEEQDW